MAARSQIKATLAKLGDDDFADTIVAAAIERDRTISTKTILSLVRLLGALSCTQSRADRGAIAFAVRNLADDIERPLFTVTKSTI